MGKQFVRWIVAIGLGISLVFGLMPGPAIAVTDEYQLVSEVWRLVNRTYLDETFNHQNWWFVRQHGLNQPLPDRAAAYDAIRQMLASLNDPYTRFLPPEQYRSLQTSTSGELTGVGLQIAKDEQDGTLAIIAPVEGSPAAAAGLQPRDRILAIDGVSTVDLSLDEAANRMRGTLGTTVNLTFKRQQAAPEALDLVRDRINLNPVSSRLSHIQSGFDVGYIRLSQFNGNATAGVAAAIAEFEAQGVAGYILDLRNNPGGLLTAGIEIARQWIDEGTIVYTVDRQGVLDSFEAKGSALTDAPLVVLVNEGTASSSEILAGALQDNHRAQLVGTRTFGKGLIQSLFDLSDGSGLVVTVAKYETPAHHDINRSGIRPDQRVSSSPTTREEVATEDDQPYQVAVDLLAAAIAPSHG
ncbi:MAG: S41 family peptidase [Cyanobacteria bacterium]|nr:S41 family peptidase [Cyanobacteriota bacterium]MDA0865668.1 S41 family peptidase [Cyanobacteriota bacterium]